jgi:hypothetical protein
LATDGVLAKDNQVKVDETSLYYLLVDNQRAALFPRTVNVYSYAVLPEPTEDSAKRQQRMETIYRGLRQLFVFPDFASSFAIAAS